VQLGKEASFQGVAVPGNSRLKTGGRMQVEGKTGSKGSIRPTAVAGWLRRSRPQSRRAAIRSLPQFQCTAPLYVVVSGLPATVASGRYWSLSELGSTPNVAIGRLRLEGDSAVFGPHRGTLEAGEAGIRPESDGKPALKDPFFTRDSTIEYRAQAHQIGPFVLVLSISVCWCCMAKGQGLGMNGCSLWDGGK